MKASWQWSPDSLSIQTSQTSLSCQRTPSQHYEVIPSNNLLQKNQNEVLPLRRLCLFTLNQAARHKAAPFYTACQHCGTKRGVTSSWIYKCVASEWHAGSAFRVNHQSFLINILNKANYPWTVNCFEIAPFNLVIQKSSIPHTTIYIAGN